MSIWVSLRTSRPTYRSGPGSVTEYGHKLDSLLAIFSSIWWHAVPVEKADWLKSCSPHVYCLIPSGLQNFSTWSKLPTPERHPLLWQMLAGSFAWQTLFNMTNMRPAHHLHICHCLFLPLKCCLRLIIAWLQTQWLRCALPPPLFVVVVRIRNTLPWATGTH